MKMRDERFRALVVSIALLSACSAAHEPELAPPPATPDALVSEPSESSATPAAAPVTPSAAPSSSMPRLVTPNPPPGPPSRVIPGGLAKDDGSPGDDELIEGDRAYFAGEYATAKKNYQAAAKAAPESPAPQVGVLRVELIDLDVPVDYAAAPGDRRLNRLRTRIDGLLAKYPDYGPLHVEKGRVALILGRAEEALASLEKGVQLAPSDPEAQSALGVALLATGQTALALERLRRASSLDPDNYERLTNLGTAYMMRGLVSDALRTYRRAAELAPDDARVQGDLGTAYLAANRPEEALPHLKRAVELAPDRATFLSNLAYAYQQRGELESAEQTCRQALKKDPKLGSAWIVLGGVLAAERKYDEAESALRKALELDPTDPRAKAALDDLAEVRKGAPGHHKTP